MKTEMKTKRKRIVSYAKSEYQQVSRGRNWNAATEVVVKEKLPTVLFLTSYPPRECGIATYSSDLIKALNSKFSNSFEIEICPLESQNENHTYTSPPRYSLNVDTRDAFHQLALDINNDSTIQIVLIQHEFGFFSNKEADFMWFLNRLTKPIIMVFHTVLPRPDMLLRVKVQLLIGVCKSVVVLTNSSAELLKNDYDVCPEKITVISHGTHLVPHSDKDMLKAKYQLTGRKILSTFGLLGEGKSIETTLRALPAIVKQNPEVLFLIIGITHPSIVKQEGERYRQQLEAQVTDLGLQHHVLFINSFLPLATLLEYLQLTDVYLFTSKDPNQAVSGTFSYAISCGCPIVSTPIPHACEVLKEDAGVIIDFEDAEALSKAVNSLLADDVLRKNISSNGLHRMAFTAWENAAISHAKLFEKCSEAAILLDYKLPEIHLSHLKKMTTDFGLIQFSNINQPDIDSGYTIDDNARAMVAICQHFELTKEEADIAYLRIYLDFIEFCLQPSNYFLNYVNEKKEFTDQNEQTNLADANGRAIWALGYLISMGNSLPEDLIVKATHIMDQALLSVDKIHSTRAMAFVIKGLYYQDLKVQSGNNNALIRKLADRLVQMYRHEAYQGWYWYESYLTYANSILPEAMLCAWLSTGEPIYKEIAKKSFDFLLTKIFNESGIHVISNKNWMADSNLPNGRPIVGGEQPIDVAYTILALSKFHEVFPEEGYKMYMKIAFDWFLGANHLQQIIYNPCTGGCYDGLEENYVNLNQGAESTVSYLMARLIMEKQLENESLGSFQEMEERSYLFV